MSKLGKALRRKYRTPQDALRALGLDAADVIGDSKQEFNMKPKQKVLTRKAAAAQGAVMCYLKPKLAKDAKMPDLTPLFMTITGKNFHDRKRQLAEGIKRKINDVLAKDADADGLVKLLDALEDVEMHEDALEVEKPGEPVHREGVDEEEDDHDEALDAEELKSFLSEKGMNEDDVGTVMDMIGAMHGGKDESADLERAEEGEDEPAERSEMADRIKEKEKAKDAKGGKDEPPPFKGRPEVGGKMTGDQKTVTKKAMDEAIAAAVKKAVEETVNKTKTANDAAIQAASKAAKENAKKIRDAENDVRPWVGTLAMAHDSAEDVYRTALGALNIEIEGVHPSAFKTILHLQPRPGTKTRIAEDAALNGESLSDFTKRYPGAARIDVL